MDTTIEQTCDPANWKWKRWDVREDGKVFWQYGKSYLNGEHWTSWENGLDLQKKSAKSQRKRYASNKNNIKEKIKKWRSENLNKYRQYQNKYGKAKRKNDPVHCAQVRVRVRIRSFMKRSNHLKESNTLSMIGCTWEELSRHIESKFSGGMSWANRNLWHIDHVIPLASAKSVEEVVKLCHYTNLQPLWAEDNLKKGAKIR